MNETGIKKEIVTVCHKLYQKGFVANHDGNVSHRIGNKLLTTPTAQSKGDVTESMLLSTDLEGKKISGKYNIFSEIKMHITVYKARIDVLSVVHAHPPYATAMSVARHSFGKPTMAEIIVSLGDSFPILPFSSPGSDAETMHLQDSIRNHDAVILGNHGVLAVGINPLQAYYRLELVEHYAKINFLAHCMGGSHAIDEATIAMALKKRTPKNNDIKSLIREEVKAWIKQKDHSRADH